VSKEKQCTCPLCNQGFTPAAGMTAGEHLARGILRTYAEMQHKGDYGTSQPCPRCGESNMSANVLHNALYWQFDIHICDACGSSEAAEGESLPLESWWAVAEILKRK